MAIGIKSYGAYLPRWLLPRELIAKAWDFPSIPGTKAFASIDEDSLTMAVEAGLDCLSGIDPKSIDGLFFASTTQVYTEKDSASLIATVLDLREDILTADFTDSLKASTTALTRAYDTIKANDDVKSILIVSADTREPEPSTMWEYGYADGAAAVLISEGDDLPLVIDDYYSTSANVTGPWKRSNTDKFIRTFEVKMDTRFYMQSVSKVINEIMTRNDLKPEDVGVAAYYYNNPRIHARVAKSLKFGQGVAQNGLFFQLGDFGTPMPFMLLISAMKRPKEDAKVILVGFGDGADAVLMHVNNRKALRDLSKNHMGVAGHQKSMIALSNYNVWLDNKKLLEKDRYVRKSSAVLMWRDKDEFVDNKEVYIHILFLFMISWLLIKADSATSIGCAIIGVCTYIGLGLPIVKRNIKYIGMVICMVGFIFIVLQLSVDILQSSVAIMGRDMTFTDRTILWKDLINIDTSPLIGTGYDSFWLGNRMAKLWEHWSWHPISSHNGYLETYLELGFVGLFLMIGVIISAYRNIRKDFMFDFDFGRFKMIFLFIILLYNVTESSFKGLQLMWFIFLLIAVKFPRPTAFSDIGSNIRDKK